MVDALLKSIFGQFLPPISYIMSTRSVVVCQTTLIEKLTRPRLVILVAVLKRKQTKFVINSNSRWFRFHYNQTSLEPAINSDSV